MKRAVVKRPGYPLVMVLLSVLILVGSVVGNYAYTRTLRNNQVQTCEASNESRKLNVQLWDYVLSFPPSRPRTEAQEQQIIDFKAFIRKTFAQRDCSKL